MWEKIVIWIIESFAVKIINAIWNYFKVAPPK